MTSLRESPIRRQPPNRPPWLIPVLIAVAVLVVLGLVYAVVSMARGGTDAAAGDESSASQPCVTRTVTPGDTLPKPAKVTVNVYNASNVAGLAGRVADEIDSRGFTVGDIENDPTGRTVTGVGEIRYGPKGAKRAQLVAVYVPGAVLVQLDRKGAKVDLALGAGFEKLAAQDEVDAALAQPTPVESGPGCAPSASASP